MSLGANLALVFAAFLTILTSVIVLAFRERRLGKRIAVTDVAAQNASDARVLVTVFGSIIGGMLLTVITAVLVFL